MIEYHDGVGQAALVHKLTEDLKDLTVRSRAVIPAHRTQLTSPRAQKDPSLAKHEFATPKVDLEPKSKLGLQNTSKSRVSVLRNAADAVELAKQSYTNSGAKLKKPDNDLLMYIQSVVPTSNTNNTLNSNGGKKRSISVNV